MDSCNTHKNDKNLQLHRFKKLQQWKEEKKVRQEKEKTTNKPVFKVNRVIYNYNLNLSKIYDEIKGKAITKTSKERPLIEPDRNKKSKPLKVKPSPGIIDTKKNNKIKAPTFQEKNYHKLSPVSRKLKRIKELCTSAVATPLRDFKFWKPKYVSTPRIQEGKH
ncbi:hypothetical protein ILUMI_06358 [Ignelater luminosus]|uniref:Uncharacterized protein n=1 Tax=Ignelater luminosus TaxID=2038154 RepID=A0A8K0D5K5_IGNLU|nr:hypothetical protein ILUMI_06358 [Ignelater luminosus]